MSEIRANYYPRSGRRDPVLDLHHIDDRDELVSVTTVPVTDARHARRVAAEHGAIEWNF